MLTCLFIACLRSQFLVLPPFQKQGHGSKLMIVSSFMGLLLMNMAFLGELYNTLYQIFMTRSEIKEITGRLTNVDGDVVVLVVSLITTLYSGGSK